MNMSSFLRLTVCCALATMLHAADAPTRDEWDPVIKAMTTANSDAEAQLAGITTKYPTWPDGWIERARYALATQHPDDGWKFAREALNLQRGSGEAAALGVQALTAMGRPSDALKVAAPFLANRTLDTQANKKVGYVNYFAAYAALAAKDTAKANEHYRAAVACAGAAIPPEFHVLDARLAIQAGDLSKAESCLSRATTADPHNWDGLYELGRVRHALAEQETSTAGKRARLDGAEKAFAAVTRALPDDYESWLGLGRAQVALARLDIDDGSDGGGHLRDAASSLKEAVKRHDALVAGWVALGEAQVRLEQFADAAASLTKARALGANEPSVLHNLAEALQKSGRGEEALTVLQGTVATSSGELLSQGMGYYHQRFYRVAIERLEAAATHADLAADSKTCGQIWRFIGHAWREWGDDLDKDGKPAVPAASIDEREQRKANAANAYRQSGDLGDVMAQRHYAALQAADNPLSAYKAGWTVLGWNAYLSGSGWAMVIGNYGAARAWDSILHFCIWGVLIGVPLLLWIKSLFRPRVISPSEPVRAKSEEAAAPRPPTGRAVREESSQSRKPSPAPQREVNPLTARKKRPPSQPPTAPRRSLPTTEDSPRPAARASDASKRRPPAAETEEIEPPKPQAKPH